MNKENKNLSFAVKLFDIYKTPLHVQRHCMKVSNVALKIGGALKEKGVELDLDLLEKACLLHDIARVEERHEIVGGDFIAKLGYFDIAKLIYRHTEFDDFRIGVFDEISLLCLADRCVIEDEYKGIDKRFEYIKNKAIKMGRSDVLPHIDMSKNKLKEYVKSIEEVLGITLKELVGAEKNV